MIAGLLIADLVTAARHVPSQTPLLLTSGRGLVRAASLPAARQGVRLGMRQRQAQVLCADASVEPFDPLPFQALADALVEQLTTFTNRIEVAPGFWQQRRDRQRLHPSAAVLFLDLGRVQEQAELRRLAGQMRGALADLLPIPPRIGLARNKFTASVAARLAQPDRPRLVPAGQEASFLAAQPVSLLPLEGEALRRLRLFGLHTLGQLAELPPGALLNQFGTVGKTMYQLAHGQDERLVLPLSPRPVEHLSLHLYGAVTDRGTLETLLHQIAGDLQHRLELRGYVARDLQLVVQPEDGGAQAVDITLRQPTSDSQVLGRSLLRLLAQVRLSSGVVSLMVRADDLKPVTWRQLDLFGDQFAAGDKLQQLLDSLTARFNPGSFLQVTAADPQHRVPEWRYQIERVEAA